MKIQERELIWMNPPRIIRYSRRAEIMKGFEELKRKYPEEFGWLKLT